MGNTCDCETNIYDEINLDRSRNIEKFNEYYEYEEDIEYEKVELIVIDENDNTIYQF